MTIQRELAPPGAAAVAGLLPRRRRNPLTPRGIVTTLALLVLVTVILWTFVPSWFTIHDPLIGDPTQRFLAPSLEHW
ncbi:MAG: hypothetical protein ACRDUB_12885, partial [Mycobacterium sp.]